MKTYLAIAYRWGELSNHHYMVYAGSDKTKALALAENEPQYRGGKYSCSVLEFNEDGTDYERIAHFNSMAKEDKPYHNHRADMFESLGHLMHDYSQGKVYLPDGGLTLKPVEVEPPQWVKDAVKAAEERAEMMADIYKPAKEKATGEAI